MGLFGEMFVSTIKGDGKTPSRKSKAVLIAVATCSLMCANHADIEPSILDLSPYNLKFEFSPLELIAP